MSNGYLRFNFWKNPKTEEFRIYANAGIGRQKFNSFCLNTNVANKYGKLPREAHLSAGMTRAFSAWWQCLGVDKNMPVPFFEGSNKEAQTEALITREELDALYHPEPFVVAEVPCYAGRSDYVITYFLITDVATLFKKYKVSADGGYVAIIAPLKRDSSGLGSIFLMQFFSMDRFFQIEL